MTVKNTVSKNQSGNGIELKQKYSRRSLQYAIFHAILFADDEWFNPEYDSYAKKHTTGEHDEAYFDYVARCVVNEITKRSAL